MFAQANPMCVCVHVLNFSNMKLNYCRDFAFQIVPTLHIPLAYSPPLLVTILGSPAVSHAGIPQAFQNSWCLGRPALS